MSPISTPDGERLIHGYNRMMERVKDTLGRTEKKTLAALQHSIDVAREKAVQLKELSHAEAERIGVYLKRDLEDAGEYLADTGEDLRAWLQFDLELVEDRLWEVFTAAADQTRLVLLDLAQRAQRASEYHTGELTTVGTLQCKACAERLHFHGTGHIPPCPRCHATRFARRGRSH